MAILTREKRASSHHQMGRSSPYGRGAAIPSHLCKKQNIIVKISWKYGIMHKKENTKSAKLRVLQHMKPGKHSDLWLYCIQM